MKRPTRGHDPLRYDPPKLPPKPPLRFTPPSLPRPKPAESFVGPLEPAVQPAPPKLRPADTVRELPPAASGWEEPVAPEPDLGGRAAFQLVRVVDGFPIARHVFTHGIVRVGRGEDCDLKLDDPLVSRYHALIERQPGERYVLHDQLSSNGIRVNGARVDRACRLQDGDVMLLGNTRLVFQTQLASRTLPPGSLEHDDLADLVIDDRSQPSDPLTILSTPPSDAAPGRPLVAGSGSSPFFGLPLGATAPAAPRGPSAPAATPAEQRPGPSAGVGAREVGRAPAPADPGVSGRVGGDEVVPSPIDRGPIDPVRAGELFELATAGPPVLEPELDGSSDDRPLPAPAEGVFGRTMAIAPARAREDQREAGVAERAFLRETEPGRWSASLAVPARAQHVISRDAYLLGAGQDVDLRLQGTLMPRVVAVIVRGVGGFSVLQVAGWPWVTKINSGVVADQARLEDGDVLTIAGRCFTFHRGLPGATP